MSEGATPGSGPREAGSGARFGGVLLAAFAALFLAQALRYAPHFNDDAYITFRYALFLATGRGPYFNPGEHVEGYTNFLLMLLEAGVIRLLGAAAAAPFAKALGVVAGAATLGASYAIAHRLGTRLGLGETWAACAGLCAASLLAVSEPFALNATSGLETTLFASLIAAGVLLAEAAPAGATSWSGLAFAAACLTRPEGVYFFGLYWLARGVRAVAVAAGPAARRSAVRPLLFEALIVAAAVALQLAFRYLAYDGELLPNTFYAKLGGSGSVSPWRYLEGGLAFSLLGIPGVVVGVVGLWLARPASVVLPLVALALGGAALPFLTGPDWMPGWRLLMPALGPAAACVALGWALLLRRLVPRSGFAPFLLLLAFAASWLGQSEPRRIFGAVVKNRALGLRTSHGPLALWLRANATPGDAVALSDIGLIGFLNPGLRILDVTGLTDRHIAKSGGGFLDKSYDVSYVFGRAPRFLVVGLQAPGKPFERPRHDVVFQAWSPVELRLVRHPDFARLYARPRPAEPPSADWLQDLAAQIGARVVFEHPLFDSGRELMAVFERQR